MKRAALIGALVSLVIALTGCTHVYELHCDYVDGVFVCSASGDLQPDGETPGL